MSPNSENPSFADLNLPKSITSALDKIGYENPSPIQAATIPILMDNHDIIGMAQTGTGKTAAFALPCLAKIDTKIRTPQALVLCPTRELAIQVAEAFQSYAANLDNFHVLPLYGGQDMRGQLRGLKRGVQVIVGTPGRLLDHLERKSLDLSELKTLVLDEADEMLRMGFIDDVEAILESTPSNRQVALFSATMPPAIRKVADKYLSNPEEVRIQTKVTTNENIDQAYWLVSGTNKLDALTRILEVEEFDGMIIFVRTKTATVELSDKLNARGFSSSPLNGDMSQQLRVRTVEQLKNGSLDILIATDVAARGLDVERISHVINYDIPYDDEAYVHRIGRTGRAGRKGKAILFVAPREKRLLQSIEKTTRQKISRMDLPSRDELIDKRVKDLKLSIIGAIKESSSPIYRDLVVELTSEYEFDAEEIAAGLVFLAQKERPLIIEKPKSTGSNKPNRDPQIGDQDKNKRNRRKKNDDSKRFSMEAFKIHVGHSDNVTPREIVGAIANEANISSKFIGKISIHESHSIVELPEDMPKETFNTLRETRVNQKKLGIERIKQSKKPSSKTKKSKK